MTTLHDFGGVLGWPLDTFFWALTNFVVTALGSCVEWPIDHNFGHVTSSLQPNLTRLIFYFILFVMSTSKAPSCFGLVFRNLKCDDFIKANVKISS